MQQDAIERLDLRQLLLEPELLEAVEPDVHLVGDAALAQPRHPGAHPRDGARWSCARSSTSSSAGSRSRTRAGGHAARSTAPRAPAGRAARRHRLGPRRSAPTCATTSPSYSTIIAETLIGYGRRQQAVAARRHAVRRPERLDGDARSSTRASSPPCSPRCGRCDTSLVVFDTAVVDLTDAARTTRSRCCSAPSSAAAPTSTGRSPTASAGAAARPTRSSC